MKYGYYSIYMLGIGDWAQSSFKVAIYLTYFIIIIKLNILYRFNNRGK